MSDKSPKKSSSKKEPTMTLKEKRSAKKLKNQTKNSIIPATGH
ncbi:MAG TPA: hypothetical protein VFW21_10480 [Mycobacterium sp.]|nr:hypothetical protein [Mycobacterium sp.]